MTSSLTQELDLVPLESLPLELWPPYLGSSACSVDTGLSSFWPLSSLLDNISGSFMLLTSDSIESLSSFREKFD